LASNKHREEVDWEAVFSGRAEPPDRETLVAKLREMRAAAEAMPRGYLLGQFAALVMMLLYGAVFVSQIHSPYAPAVFIVVFITCTIFVHYIVVVGRLRRLMEGER